MATQHVELSQQLVAGSHVELFEPAEVRLPQGRVTLRRIRFHADSPADFLKAVRHHLP